MKRLVEAEVEYMESQRRELSRHIGALVGLDSVVCFAAKKYRVPKASVYNNRPQAKEARQLVWAILASEGLQIVAIARAWGLHKETVGIGVGNARRSQAKDVAEYFQLHKGAA